ncbi:MAG TPA: PQQ-dependent sugar dehydrogenase [Candidatus Paceibacterota bacterium]|nr:PQQ-dependent sugar dehydrogenase [Candidatus Paceibacterota bacterium]
MKKHSIAVAIVATLLVVGAFGLWRFLLPFWPAIGPSATIPSTTVSPAPSGPLGTAEGWISSLLVDQVPGARDLAVDPFGNVWVSQTSEGMVSLVTLAGETAPRVDVILRDLDRPHGLAFHPEFPTMLYIATETAIFRVPTYSDGPLERIAALPEGGRHFTRSLAFGPDGRLYVSIGSTCDVCHEKNAEIASVISMKDDGSDRRTVATGLRNAVFIAFHPRLTGTLFTTEMGRDLLGDQLPPDEVNSIDTDTPAADYGWPICYGDRVHDTKFDQNQYIRDPCADTIGPVIALPAHVAPLGLAFLKNGDLLVAEHGSWNSSVPVGYKVVRFRWNDGAWSPSDFLTGFLVGNSAMGRPVDVLPMPDGSVLVSDDKAGAIWKITPQ